MLANFILFLLILAVFLAGAIFLLKGLIANLEIRDEVNELLPSDKRYGGMYWNFQRREVPEQHKQMFPKSDKVQKFFRYGFWGIVLITLSIVLASYFAVADGFGG